MPFYKKFVSVANREPVNLKTAKPFSNSAAHKYQRDFLLLNYDNHTFI